MNQISPYLTFNGNCRQAMTFYQKCLGGELLFQTVGETLATEKMPKKMKNCILHAILTHGHLIIMGSDLVNEEVIKGNAVSLSLNCCSKKQITLYFKKLAKGGVISQALLNNSSGGVFGTITDKFGNHWILNYK